MSKVGKKMILWLSIPKNPNFLSVWPWEKWQSISWPLGTFGPLPHPLGLIWHPFKLIEYYKKCPLVVLKMSIFLPFVAHANHLIFWRIGYSSELLDTKAGNQNSDQNPWRISQEFCGHRTLDNNSDQNPFNNFIIIPWSSNFLIRRLVIFKMNQQNSDQNPRRIL